MPELEPESEKYTPEEAYSEASKIRDRLSKDNPGKEGAFSGKDYEKTHESIEQQNEMVKSATRVYFEGICDKYEPMADLGLDFDKFNQVSSKIQHGEDAEIKDVTNLMLHLIRFSQAEHLAGQITLGLYSSPPEPFSYSSHDLEQIKQAAAETRDLGVEVDIPDVILKAAGPIKIEDPAINRALAEILQKADEIKRERAEKLFCDKFGCPAEKFGELRRLYNLCLDFAKRYKAIIEIEENEQNNENYSRITETLNDPDVRDQLRRREAILRKMGLGFLSHASYSDPQILDLKINVAEKAAGLETEEDDDLVNLAYNEQEVVYAAGILGFKRSTKEMVETIKKAMQNAHESLPDPDSIRRHSYDIKEHIFEEMWENFFVGSLTGKRVFEVGGKKAIEGLQKMGAITVEPADAGHSGYTAFYHTGSREDMIEVANYREFCDPHSVDLVCSCRLFDMGSGIGKIAEPSHSGQERDHLGEREMMLVLTNVLKDGGFMIHYNSPLEDSLNGLGLTDLGRVFSEADIYHWHQDTMDIPSDFYVGKKHMVYNSETKTFERAE